MATNTEQHVLLRSRNGSAEAAEREELVRRVAGSGTFEKSPRLRAFFSYVCRCALDDRPEAATEHQIGIEVFGRSPDYNPSEDNIVRSQARLLRLKLEHHFANEGKREKLVITIPKGRYVPSFERRFEEAAVLSPPAMPEAVAERFRYRLFWLRVAVAIACGVAIILAAIMMYRSGKFAALAPARRLASKPVDRTFAGAVANPREIRIAAGNSGEPYVDLWGRRWDADRYYEGGVAHAAPGDLYPPVADPGLFRTVRESASGEYMVSQADREFRYNIPAPPGVYELRLYFADPFRHANPQDRQDAQNTRHFRVVVNGLTLLSGFDAVADAGPAPVDVRVFRDVTPGADGMVHVVFGTDPEQPFVNALELTPGVPGKLTPIRFTARKQGFVDADGTRWGGDNYFMNGRTLEYGNPETGPKVPPLYTAERFGNFSYAIPVTPGSYTLKLHFAETFFDAATSPAGLCRGAGCRVFDVMCNGEVLLRDFDIYRAASGAFQPVVRTFHGLHPNGQGKLLLSFSPRVNYAEVRAIEVIDEGR